MTEMTPEAARAAAEWLDADDEDDPSGADRLRAEADRLENAAKTPGQVARAQFTGQPSIGSDSPVWNAVAAAVIAHVVGPDNVIVSRAVIQRIVDNDDIHWQAEEHFAEALK